MPTPDQIEKLKEIFGPIHKMNIDGVSYIIRTLNRKDLNAVGIFADGTITPEKEEQIFTLSVIEPLDIDMDSIPAGTISIICETVLEKSGVLGIESLQLVLEKARAKKNIFTEIYGIICCAFPAILPGDLDSLPVDRLMELFILSEDILKMQGIIEEDLSFEKPEDEQPQESDEAKADRTAQLLQNAMAEAQQNGYI